MKKYVLVILVIILSKNNLIAHCQVPCGIYNDSHRISEIIEDFKTINKAMLSIKDLSKNSDSLSKNQLNRWIITKENHASNIQKIVSNYFLSQRIKSSNDNYIEQIIKLQELLVIAMKCKQTLDLKLTDDGIDLIHYFSKIYLDYDELQHLKKNIKKNK